MLPVPSDGNLHVIFYVDLGMNKGENILHEVRNNYQ